MGKSRDLTEFERGMIVGARIVGCSISMTVDRLGFSKTAVSRVYREWCEKRKTCSQRLSCGRKRLVDDCGERRMEQVVEENSEATVVQIQALYNSSGPEKPISHRTTRRTLKRLGYSHRSQKGDNVTLALAGLEAVAAFTSGSDQLEAPKHPVSSTKEEAEPEVQSEEASVVIHSSESSQCNSNKDMDAAGPALTILVP